jgi:3',5'-cyclic AMP phosphodiesterase CpdA
MIRIAHLSDIHFGPRFDLATWRAVGDEVIGWDPDLIVVSGDLVDQPSATHLLAAKCELRRLSVAAKAELVVIPGNHDVFEWGNSVLQTRQGWYERVFDSANTDAAEAALKGEIGCDPGFNDECRNRAAVLPGFWARVFGTVRKDFSRFLGPPQQPVRIRVPGSTGVMLALFDSNPRTRGVDLATGLISDDQLTSLKSAVDKVQKRGKTDEAYLARIAVVHHHVLPIAFAGGRQARLEPAMVLRNAGALLRNLADLRFDLVLHGHWHKPQCARLDFGAEDADGYPITVAAAGSAAMRTEVENGNCFNFITVSDNGRITVKSVFYGAGQPPDPNGEAGRQMREFPEPIAAVKRRAFIRARERHRLECDVREQSFTISENGDLWIGHKVEGLRRLAGTDAYRRRPMVVYFPEYGRFVEKTFRLDDASRRAGLTFEREKSADKDLQRYWIVLPGDGLVQGAAPVDYYVEHACANCMAMTRWETEQRLRAKGPEAAPVGGPHEEWVGMRVVFPVDKLILSAAFPESLAAVQPYVCALRHPHYPRYAIDEDLRDAELPRVKDLVVDREVQEEEQSHLRFTAEDRTWRLEIERPMVGYHYQLRWAVPGEEPDPQIAGTTSDVQEELLAMARRIESKTPTARDKAAIAAFEVLRSDILKLCGGGADEQWLVALFVYDAQRLALYPVLSHLSWTAGPMGHFEIPLGDGVVGAAFQQRRLLPWGQWADESLIEPVPRPAVAGETPVRPRNLVAVPIYHPDRQDDRRPPPWATIGALSFGSSLKGSPISELNKQTPKAEARRRVLRSVVQTQVVGIIEKLRGG